MTVDVEDYFQVVAFEEHIARDRWDGIPGRVEGNTNRILDILGSCGATATFFVLGWVAERYPHLVRRIADAGHEVASHGFSHVRLSRQTPPEFKRDVKRAKHLLEDVVGRVVQGYRAPTFSLVAGTLWAVDVLSEVGYRYSSSVYPIRHDLYGMREAPRFPFYYSEGSLLEIPMTTLNILSYNLPCAGGGYFRLFPYLLSRWALRQVNQREKRPAVFYFHPWEIDPTQPRQFGIPPKTQIRHYLNLKRMESRILRLLTDFRWSRMDTLFLESIEWPYEVAQLATA
jgi:polysaccharide deacetylase family protein (PEP-CTERM system associated)